jgi:predicted ATP-grasp superfamily ATP-dependent carboligase
VRARTWDELAKAYGDARSHGFPVVVQEEIPGASTALFSLGLYATSRGEVVAAFTSQKLCQVPADFGDGLVVKAILLPELIPLGERVVRRFGYHGMADLEFKWDPRDRTFKLLDVNPRPWLWINLPTACGVNLPYAAYLDAVGHPLDPREFVQRDDQIRWTSLRGLLVYAVRSLRGGRPLADLLAVFRVLAYPRGRRLGPLLSGEDPLVGMFVNPHYWQGALRGAVGGLRRMRLLGQGR